MDIDALTGELQVRSRARSSRAHLSAVTSRPPSSLASSVDVVSHPTPNRPTAASLPIPPPRIHQDDADTRSDADSVANSSEAESRISEAEEIYAPSVSAVSTSKSAYHTAMSGSFMSETNSVTRSWVVESTTSGPGDTEIERSRSPAASAASSGKGHNSETASATGDEEGERLMVCVRAVLVSINEPIDKCSFSQRACSVRRQIRQIRQQIRRQIRTILVQKPNYGTKLKCSVSHTYRG